MNPTHIAQVKHITSAKPYKQPVGAQLRNIINIFYLITAFGLTLTGTVFAKPGTASVFRFRSVAEPKTLDWNIRANMVEQFVLANTMEGLTEVDSSLQPQPSLANHWEVSEDKTTYTFYLKPEARWSDGVPFTADDVLTSWKRLLSPEINSIYGSFFYDIVNAQEFREGKLKDFSQVGIKVLDKHRLRVNLKSPADYFPLLVSCPFSFPVRKDLIAKWGEKWALPPVMPSLGPYILKSWTKGKELVLQVNPKYHGKKPQIERVQIVITPEYEMGATLFSERKLDILQNATESDILRLRVEGRQFRTELFKYLSTDYLGFNLNSPKIADPSVRKAIAMAIDPKAVIDGLHRRFIPADSFIPIGMRGSDPTVKIPFDPVKAKALLSTSNDKNLLTNGISILVEPGPPTDVARIVGDMIKRNLGIPVSVRTVPLQEFRAEAQKNQHELMLGVWAADFPDPANFMRVFLSNSSQNSLGFKNKDYDRLVLGAVKGSPTESVENYKVAQKILIQDIIALKPLFHVNVIVLVDPRVTAFEITPQRQMLFKRMRVKQ